MTIDDLKLLKEHNDNSFPPRSILYSGIAILNRGTRNQRDGMKGYYSYVDSIGFFNVIGNRNEYRNFLEENNLNRTRYDESILSEDRDPIIEKLESWK